MENHENDYTLSSTKKDYRRGFELGFSIAKLFFSNFILNFENLEKLIKEKGFLSSNELDKHVKTVFKKLETVIPKNFLYFVQALNRLKNLEISEKVLIVYEKKLDRKLVLINSKI